MKFAVIVFPGSNCDHDAYHAAKHVLGQEAALRLAQGHAICRAPTSSILPGGFSHGDYLRTGAIARFSPVMRAVQAFADRGGPVLGICNGFQILLEAGLLPGAMLRNRGAEVPLRARARARRADGHAVHVAAAASGQVLRIPIAPRRRQLLRAARRARTRSRRTGRSSSATRRRTASVDRRGEPERLAAHHRRHLQRARATSSGMMPHPERACEPALGSTDGLVDLRIGRASRRSRGALVATTHEPIDRRRSSTATASRRDEYERIVDDPRPRAEPDRARHLLGDVVRALQLQELARAPEDAADRRAARAAGPGRERRRRRHRRRARGASFKIESHNHPSLHRAVSRARRPASAASSATSSRWARGRSRC